MTQRIDDLISRLQEIRKIAGNVEIYRHNDEFNTCVDIEVIELVKTLRSKHVSGVWPNCKYEWVADSEYWEIK